MQLPSEAFHTKMNQEIQEAYKKLAKKYSLPAFEAVNHELELSTIENADFLLRDIRHKLVERIDFFAKLIEEQLHPEGASFSSLNESSDFTESEKKKIYVLYKKLMFIIRRGIETVVENDENDVAAYISTTFAAWHELKKEISAYTAKLKESWAKDIEYKEDLGYMG